MELGNLLFGHSRGRYEVDRDMIQPLGDLMYLMGYDEYGRNPLTDRKDKPFDIRENQRTGVDLYDKDGALIMRTRPYWWGDTDSKEGQAQAELPNLEIPSLGFELNWYKHPFRDSYCNRPLGDVLDDILRLLKPYGDRARQYWLNRLNRYPWIRTSENGTITIRTALMPLNTAIVAHKDNPDGSFQFRTYQCLGNGVFKSRHNGEEYDAKTVACLVSGLSKATVDAVTDREFNPLIDLDIDVFDRLSLLGTVEWRA